jgi:hypothetical protein
VSPCPRTRLGEHDVQEEPLLFLGCGHVYTLSTLDGHAELSKFYQPGASGALEPAPLQADFTAPPTCPECRAPSLTLLRRYGRPLKKALLENALKK